MVMEQSANPWTLLVRPEIKRCEDLEGQRIGLNSAGSVSTALLRAYIALNCPGVTPEEIFIPGSDNRAIALGANQIDGSLLELADVIALERAAPGRYVSLINFSDALPKLKTNGVYVNKDFARQHAETVRDYLRAVLTVQRQIEENPQILQDGLVKHLRFDPEAAKVVATAYLDRESWNVNGGMGGDDVQYSIDFFVRTGGLPRAMSAPQVSDLSYLEAVLDSIGRK
jgi:ABC-type nitrate/sulfonate/bicarbonate transport system substrate-binding protein